MESPPRSDCSQAQKWLGLRFLIPSLLLAAFLLDGAMRLLPPGYIYFRAWDVASLFATAEGPFAPNFHYERDRAYGDLSNLGNLPRLRQYHTEVFTTDEFGFRNLPGEGAGEMPDAILVGDSFAVGSGVSDGDTLSVQLSRLSKMRVYNGAGPLPKWKRTKELLERLHMRGGLVIWETSEREAQPESVRTESRVIGVAPKTISPVRKKYPILQKLDLWTDSLLAYSPLGTILSRVFRKMENDVWLPNPSENLVSVGHLHNGDSMLFLRSEVENFYRPKNDSPNYLAEINALVHCSGNDLLVVLVPDKYGVYHSLLRDEQQAPPEGKSHLNQLEEDLQRLGIPVLNLTSALRSQAAEGVQRREYNYLLDDTHWNRIGIQTAATEILRVWGNHPGSICNTSADRNASPAAR
jgi:hypothetical protein